MSPKLKCHTIFVLKVHTVVTFCNNVVVMTVVKVAALIVTVVTILTVVKFFDESMIFVRQVQTVVTDNQGSSDVLRASVITMSQ